MKAEKTTSLFGLEALTTDDIPEGKPCFALIFDFPYQVKKQYGKIKACSLPCLPLFLGENEKYELEINFETWDRLSRAYGSKDKWVGKPVLLKAKGKRIQCYPMRTCTLRYNWSLRDSLNDLYCEIRCWIYMHITHRNEDEYSAPANIGED